MIRRALAIAACFAIAAACSRRRGEGEENPRMGTSPSGLPQVSISRPVPAPAPRQGMVWIPGGALVVGTPVGLLPRKVDEEMKGEQVILRGFYIDVFPYPNEEGAIPLTNLTHAEAATLCAEAGKRLCSELEWERACKGPDNRIYEYGDRYRPDRCGTGVVPGLRPAGLKVGCQSDFGVRDLHGGAFEWTSSRWERGTSGEIFTIRGGNSTAGEVVGRCANGAGRPANTRSGTIGVRCCVGPPNSAEVVLKVQRGKSFDRMERLETGLAGRLLAALPEEAREQLTPSGRPRVDKVWIWRPVGNEEFVSASVCSGLGVRPVCGVFLSRDELGRVVPIAWAPSGSVPPSLQIGRDPRDVWLSGGDEQGRYKRLIAYSWGRVTVHPEERAPRKPRKGSKSQGASHSSN